MKGLFHGSFAKMRTALVAALLLLPAAATAQTMRPGASGPGDGPFLTRPDGTANVDNGGVWGVMTHRADVLRARHRAFDQIVKPADPSLAVSGFDRLVVLSSRFGSIYSDVPPVGLMPANVPNFNQGLLYNKYAGIGLAADGHPNTLAVAYANVLSNTLDTYFGNYGNLQTLGSAPPNMRPPPGGLSASFSTGVSANAVAQVNFLNFAGTIASDLGLTKSGDMSEFGQTVNNFLYAELTASPTEISGGNTAGGTLIGTPLLPFSQLTDALDYQYAAGPPGGPAPAVPPDTWADILLAALSTSPTGSMKILRSIPGPLGNFSMGVMGSAITVPPSGTMDLYSDSGGPTVLSVGLKTYYGALCNVFAAKLAIYALLNGPTGLPVLSPTCDPTAVVRPTPAGLTGLVQAYYEDYGSLTTGFLGSPQVSMSGLSWTALDGGGATPGYNRAGRIWAGAANNRLGAPGVQFGGPTPGMPYMAYSDMVTQSAPGNAGPVFNREIGGAENAQVMNDAQQDLVEVMQPPAPPTAPVPTPNSLPSWRATPVIAPGSDPATIVGQMP